MPLLSVVLAACVPAALGLVVVARSARRSTGWLLVAHGVSVALLLVGRDLLPDRGAGLVVQQFTQGAWVFLIFWLVLVAHLVPEGWAGMRRRRAWIAVGSGGCVALVAGAAGDAGAFGEENGGRPLPVTWLPEPVAGAIGMVGLVLVVAFVAGSVLAVRTRLRSAEGDERLQLLWLVWGSLAVPVGLVVLWADHFVLGGREPVAAVTLTAMSVLLPSAMAVAITRYRLFDVELVLSRTLTYVVLTGGLAALYLSLMLVAGRILGATTWGGLVAVAAVAVAVHPAYTWLRRRAERLVYGVRADPTQALRLLAVRTEVADVGAVTTAAAGAVAEALGVPRVWIVVGDRPPPPHAEAVSLRHGGVALGHLVLETPPGRRLSAADRLLLDGLATYVAVLVHSGQQAVALSESRSRLVVAREEERRRVRRDLHDGIGPSLAAVVLSLGAAASRADEEERSRLLREAQREVRDAIVELRRVVEDLRPPAIDEVGLLSAIRQRSGSLSSVLATEVEGPEPMPSLPAAVEVAAFRIASEALTNTARHSAATRCRVRIDVDSALHLTVTDNGGGPDPHAAPGLGWTSMRERAAELGGTCTIGLSDDGGVAVRAELPLVAPVRTARPA